MQLGVSADIRTPEGFLRGSSIIAEIKASRIEFVLSVPDITTSEGLLHPLSQGSAPRLIRVCKEDEGVGICAGLSYTGRRSLLLIQQTGLLDSINAVRGGAMECASSSPSLMQWALHTTRSKRRPMWRRSGPLSTTRTPKAGRWCC